MQSEYARLKAVLEAGQKVEEQFGIGSLLKLSHPATIRFAAKRAIDPEKLTNAQRFEVCLNGQSQDCSRV